jgi:hypothetical protein
VGEALPFRVPTSPTCGCKERETHLDQDDLVYCPDYQVSLRAV